MDPRLTPTNGRVAAEELRGQVTADRFSPGEWTSCRIPVADICAEPDGKLSSQLLFGERFRVLESNRGWSFGQVERDRYVGYVRRESLTDDVSPTHRVMCLSTSVYDEPDIKSRPTGWFPFGAVLVCGQDVSNFMEIRGGGYVPQPHLRRLSDTSLCPVTLSRQFLGLSYLWGGNGPLGIDCSGLVQMTLLAAGYACPRDSDMQWQWMIENPAARAIAAGNYAFWEGHVGIVDTDDMLIHATAHHMQVVREPLATVKQRIETSSNDKFLGVARLPHHS
ncbi:MAG: NlpC/P60 family protein [Rhodobacteraceae bacterium]|nr:NlpC/P60 family protein [Paracoccaceae bacterium]MCY4196212.1 NlpC/P60 family protein [Paracoccaceae bacterium]MCY4326696.1 NlpC/P60 family protein [Paracoccaceae bacterium]